MRIFKHSGFKMLASPVAPGKEGLCGGIHENDQQQTLGAGEHLMLGAGNENVVSWCIGSSHDQQQTHTPLSLPWSDDVEACATKTTAGKWSTGVIVSAHNQRYPRACLPNYRPC